MFSKECHPARLRAETFQMNSNKVNILLSAGTKWNGDAGSPSELIAPSVEGDAVSGHGMTELMKNILHARSF